MLYLTALTLLTIFLIFLVNKMLYKDLTKEQDCYGQLKEQYNKAAQQGLKLKNDNLLLEKTVEETAALYDITKDIRKIIDEGQIFDLFKGRINRYFRAGDCLFLKSDTDLSGYKDYTAWPLTIEKNAIGYLLAKDIRQEDKDKFQILTQQFLAGIKGVHLFKQVQELSVTDSLTKIFNRRYFMERVKEEFERAKRFKFYFSFLLIDLDHFKEYNDRYGHLAGDAILKETVKIMQANTREVDFMGRYGGEELSILLVEANKEQARYAAERIRQAIESSEIKVYDEELKVTVSVGIATFPDDAIELSLLIEMADQALYQAKENGRNRVSFYSKNKEGQG